MIDLLKKAFFSVLLKYLLEEKKH